MSGLLPVGSVYTEVHQNVGWLTIDNPRKRNALSAEMMDQLGGFLQQLRHDASVRVVVLRGAGHTAFAAGADIAEFDTRRTTAVGRRIVDDAVTRLLGQLETFNKPLLAMIGGHCIGAGLAVALSADIRIASPASSFAIPAARLGIGYPAELTRSLTNTVGPGVAAEILFTARTLDASEALSVGLVNRLVPTRELENAVRSLAIDIAANAPLSIQAAKLAIRSSAQPGLCAQADRLVDACAGSNDAREGYRAFMERRSPRFNGN